MLSKLLKGMILALYVTMSLSLAFMIKNEWVDNQIKKEYNLSGYKEFYVSSIPSSKENYQDIVNTIERVSKESDALFCIRTPYIGVEHDNKGTANFLSNISRITFYGLEHEDKKLSAHGVTSFINYKKFSSLSFEEFHEGSFLYKPADSGKSKFVTNLSQALSQKYGIEITSETLEKNPTDFSKNPPLILTNDNLSIVITVSLIFYFIFLFVWLAENNKKIAVYKLSGFENIDIANLIFIKKMFWVFATTYAVATIFILKKLSFDYTKVSLLIFMISTIITLFAVWIVARVSIVNQVNNKSFFKYSHIFLYLVKTIIFAISLSTLSGLLTLVHQSLDLSKTEYSDYGALYAPMIGFKENLAEPTYYNKLIRAQEELGGIHASENNLSSQIGLESLKTSDVNINYLKKHPILDKHNQAINISSEEENMVLLIADKLMKTTDIKDRIVDTFKARPGFTSSIKFYEIKENQKVIIYANKIKKVSADIVILYTPENDTGENLVPSLENPYAMLIPLTEPKESIYKKLRLALEDDGHLSRYPSFINAKDIKRTTLLLTVGNPINYFFINLFSVILFACMIISTVVFYVITYRKKIVVYRSLGCSWLRTYLPLVTLIVLQYIIGFINAKMNGADQTLLELLMLYLFMEFAIVIGVLKRTEKKDLLNILKGE
ncbi:DUF1430 domain-containing protein [Lactococcus ileimucosae]|uniref:DUF1430 domain-containing protein n=1 Tax=Lactococcus ileimucosae TaxID=2941329 RepID=A0ABV4D0J7_9LACT